MDNTTKEPTERKICQGFNKAGKRCKRPAVPGSDYCRWHQDQSNQVSASKQAGNDAPKA